VSWNLIITRQKPPEKIDEMVAPYGSVFIVGCGTCATGCGTGGEEQVKAMAQRLGSRAIGWAVVESPCDARINRRDLAARKGELEGADAVLCMACGAGAQAVAEYADKAIIPALDTLFIGKTERLGRYFERCRACADCILLETGGVCPTVRCSKGLINGPCGGQVKGKCEVGDYKNDCAWVLIFNSLKRQNRLDVFRKYRPPKDRSAKARPQELASR
jgi:hypothetical protein